MRNFKIAVFLLIVISIQLFTGLAYADNGLEINLFYSFDSYQGETGENPDENWKAKNASLSGYSSFMDDGNPCMKIMKGAEPSLLFGQVATSGELHISLKLKVPDSSMTPTIALYDGREPGDTALADTVATAWSKTMVLNTDKLVSDDGYVFSNQPGAVSYHTDGRDDLECFKIEASQHTFDFTQWHRFDIVTTTMASGRGTANYYIDGIKINPTPLSFGYCQGFKSITIKANANGGNDSYLLLDDISVRRYYEDKGVEAIVNEGKGVERDCPEFNVYLTDMVDSSLLTKDNIVIMNISSGQAVEDFAVTHADASSFGIKINQELNPGVHTVFVKNLRGTVSGASMTAPGEFRTVYRSETVQSLYLNEDFSEYQLDGSVMNLPDGWYMETGKTPESLVATDADGGKTFGIQNGGTVGRRTRYVAPLTVDVGEDIPYDIEFKVASHNLKWELSVFTEALELVDGAVSEIPANSFLMSVDKDNNLSYSRTGGTSMTQVDTLTASGQASYRIHIEPKSSSETQYTFYVNGVQIGDTVTSARNFQTKSTRGIGFSFVPVDAEDNYLYINDVKVQGEMEVMYPEPEGITLFDYDGNTLDWGDAITTSVSKIAVSFNTVVDEASVKEKCVLRDQDGNQVLCEYQLTKDGEQSLLYLLMDTMLEPSVRYTITLHQGIASAYASEIQSEFELSKSFATKINYIFNVYENAYDEATGIYTVKLAKNDASEFQGLICLAAYQTETKDEKDYKVLKSFDFCPVMLDTTDRGHREYTCKIDGDRTGLEIVPYFCSYPDFLSIDLGVNGEIN